MSPTATALRANDAFEATDLDTLRRYDADQRARGLSERTVEVRRYGVLAASRHAGRPVLEVRTEDLVRWLASKAEATAKARYEAYNCARAFYRWALAGGLIDEDPTRSVPRESWSTAPEPRLPAPTVDDDVIERFQAWSRRRGLAAGSLKHRRLSVLMLARHARKSLLHLTYDDVSAWVDSRAHLADRTLYCNLSHISAFYKWAIDEGLVSVDPSARVPRPRLKRLLPRPLGDADLELALSRSNERTRCWLLLAAYGGLRAKEVAALQGEDLRYDNTPPMLRVQSGKGGHQRDVPLHPTLVAALKAYGAPARGPIFEGQRGAITAHTVSAYVCGHLSSLGISGGLHSCRHWFATNVYRSSKDIRLTQELLGHASIATTAIYTQVDTTAAAQVIGGLRATP